MEEPGDITPKVIDGLIAYYLITYHLVTHYLIASLPYYLIIYCPVFIHRPKHNLSPVTMMLILIEK